MKQPEAQCVHEDGYEHPAPYRVLWTNGGNYRRYETCSYAEGWRFSLLMFMAETAWRSRLIEQRARPYGMIRVNETPDERSGNRVYIRVMLSSPDSGYLDIPEEILETY